MNKLFFLLLLIIAILENKSEIASTKLEYQNGCIVPSFGMNLVFVGPTPSVDLQVYSFVKTLLSNFNVKSSPYAVLLSQYLGPNINVGLGESFTQITTSNISDTYLQQLTNSGVPGLQVPFFIVQSGSDVDFGGVYVCYTCKVMGYHNRLANGKVYAVIAYNSMSDFAMAFSKELAELMTNPLGNGWMAPNPNNPNQLVEIADICAAETPTYVPYATATFGDNQSAYISKLWSNYDSACTVTSTYTPADTFAIACPNVVANSWSSVMTFKLSTVVMIMLSLFWMQIL